VNPSRHDRWNCSGGSVRAHVHDDPFAVPFTTADLKEEKNTHTHKVHLDTHTDNNGIFKLSMGRWVKVNKPTMFVSL
jgi:hypothetical protein